MEKKRWLNSTSTSKRKRWLVMFYEARGSGRSVASPLFAMAPKAAGVAGAAGAGAGASSAAGAAGAGAAGAAGAGAAVWVHEYNLAAQVDRVTTPRWRNAWHRFCYPDAYRHLCADCGRAVATVSCACGAKVCAAHFSIAYESCSRCLFAVARE